MTYCESNTITDTNHVMVGILEEGVEPSTDGS